MNRNHADRLTSHKRIKPDTIEGERCRVKLQGKGTLVGHSTQTQTKTNKEPKNTSGTTKNHKNDKRVNPQNKKEGNIFELLEHESIPRKQKQVPGKQKKGKNI